MATSFYLILFAVILISEIGFIIYKIYKTTQKFDKLYNFFIRSEKDLVDGQKSRLDKIPPVNGECPTKEELENFNN